MHAHADDFMNGTHQTNINIITTLYKLKKLSDLCIGDQVH